MKKNIFLGISLSCFLFFIAYYCKNDSSSVEYHKSYIGEGTKYESPYYVFTSPNKGSTVLLEAGIHGDEIAGIYALDTLLNNIKIHSGKLIIFPRMNRPACTENKRFINTDLNLIFPGSEDKEVYEYLLAQEIYKMVEVQNVEYVVTLHESRYLHDPSVGKTFGQTIVYGTEPPPAYLSEWLDRINEHTQLDSLTNKSERFYPYYYPIPTSSTEIFVEDYNLKGGFCVETWRGFSLERRIELQKIVILSFLNAVNFKYTVVNKGQNSSQNKKESRKQ